VRVRSFLGKVYASAEHIVIGGVVDDEGFLLVFVYLFRWVGSGTVEKHHFFKVGSFGYFLEVALLLCVHLPNKPVLDSLERYNWSNLELLRNPNKLTCVLSNVM